MSDNMRDRDREICFLFGAGAETSYGLPSGPDFTEKTMLRKYDELYDALEGFYSASRLENYVARYQRNYLFARNSHTFAEIIFRAAAEAKKHIDSETEPIDKESKKAMESVYESEGLSESEIKEKWSVFKEIAQNAYKSIVEDSPGNVNSQPSEREPFVFIRKYISYYGAVEKDFSTIINPSKAGLAAFWRLINYFWAAFFEVFLPVMGERDRNKNIYSIVLGDLVGQMQKYFPEKPLYKNDGSYYNAVQKSFPNTIQVITTNYTPYVEHHFNRENISFLAGKLSWFEIPNELRVVDLASKDLDKASLDNKFLFPFIMTQAPIKPIISPLQLREYGRALKALDNSDTLVIIGYSLCEEDTHICAMIRDFLSYKNNRIFYCEFKKEGTIDEEKVQMRIAERLHCVGEAFANKILVIHNNGDAEKLVNQIKELL